MLRSLYRLAKENASQMASKKLYPPGKPNVFGFPRELLGEFVGWLMGRLSV
jgi:hypothetical protein